MSLGPLRDVLFNPTVNQKLPQPFHHKSNKILDQFTHVFPEEIPPGLPPRRFIQHHIDLIPGSVLPNKLAYRMNPKDTQEIPPGGGVSCQGNRERKPEPMRYASPFGPKEGWQPEDVCRQQGN